MFTFSLTLIAAAITRFCLKKTSFFLLSNLTEKENLLTELLDLHNEFKNEQIEMC